MYVCGGEREGGGRGPPHREEGSAVPPKKTAVIQKMK